MLLQKQRKLLTLQVHLVEVVDLPSRKSLELLVEAIKISQPWVTSLLSAVTVRVNLRKSLVRWLPRATKPPSEALEQVQLNHVLKNRRLEESALEKHPQDFLEKNPRRLLRQTLTI